MPKGRTAKAGQRPFYTMTQRKAATRAAKRRGRHARGRGRRTWLNAWPRGGNQPQSGNGGHAPRYMYGRIGKPL